MNLLFCIKALNNPGGGAERVMVDVVNGLVARGHRVSVLSYDLAGRKSFYKLDSRIERIELGLGSTIERATPWSTAQRIWALRPRIKRLAPDVAVGFMHSMFIPLGYALSGSGIPLIASEHIIKEHYRSRPIEWILFLTTPFFVHRITCVSPQVISAYPRFLQHKMVTIGNPVTIRAPSGARADVSGATKVSKVLLTVGRLEEQKDHETLIRAFARVAGALPDWTLRIIGEGSLRPKLKALVRNMELEGRIEMPGATQDIGAEYINAQLFVSPSRYESFGLTTAEALTHGLPVVGFVDCPGTNMLIRPSMNGELVDPADNRIHSLSQSLQRLMEDEERRKKYAANSVSTVSSYGLDVVLDAWERLLSELKG